MIPRPGALPFDPLRPALYAPEDLFLGFSADDPSSYASMLDVRIFAHYVRSGRGIAPDPFEHMMRALHDHSIHQHLAALLDERRVIAVMGGQSLRRGTKAYVDVAEFARGLTTAGCLVTTPGGPGAMEAAHLGALHARAPAEALGAAIETLARAPDLPADAASIVNERGEVDQDIARRVFAWHAPAMAILDSLTDRGVSVSVPNYRHGHEPATPFATHIAKYFQNATREEGLISLARHGIVFAEGKAGTIQEIFQDAALNHYRSFGHVIPMVFLGNEHWTKKYPVLAVLRALLPAADFDRHVLVTDDIREAAAFLSSER